MRSKNANSTASCASLIVSCRRRRKNMQARRAGFDGAHFGKSQAKPVPSPPQTSRTKASTYTDSVAKATQVIRLKRDVCGGEGTEISSITTQSATSKLARRAY